MEEKKHEPVTPYLPRIVHLGEVSIHTPTDGDTEGRKTDTEKDERKDGKTADKTLCLNTIRD